MPGYRYRGTTPYAPDPEPIRTTCGTTAGYYAHRRAGEEQCDACLNAYNTSQRERRAARNARKVAA